MYADIAGMLQVGDNSDQSGGYPEFTLRPGSTVGQKVWDSDLTDGFDSGDVPVCLSATAGSPGSASWMVSGGSPGTLSGQITFGVIHSVEILANARAGGKVSWSNLTITFFKDGQPTQTITIPIECHPIADPMLQVLEVVPDSDDNTGVVVTGSVRLRNAGTSLPGPTDMTAGVQVLTT